MNECAQATFTEILSTSQITLSYLFPTSPYPVFSVKNFNTWSLEIKRKSISTKYYFQYFGYNLTHELCSCKMKGKEIMLHQQALMSVQHCLALDFIPITPKQKTQPLNRSLGDKKTTQTQLKIHKLQK